MMSTKDTDSAADALSDDEEKIFFEKASAAFFANKSLIAHQIDSYNHFTSERIERIFEDAPTVIIRPNNSKLPIQAEGVVQSAEISFRLNSMHMPEWTDREGKVSNLYPTEARLRKMTYNASIYADFRVKIFTSSTDDEEDENGNNLFWQRTMEETTPHTKIPAVGKILEKEEILLKAFVGKLPVMVMSNRCHFSNLGKEDLSKKYHCHFDKGGYFIINGSEKVLISQEGIGRQFLCTAIIKQGGFRCIYRSSTTKKPMRTIQTTAKIVFSVARSKIPQRIPLLTVLFSGLKSAVPAVILFRALGIANDKELVERICEDVDDNEMKDVLSSALYLADEEMGLFLKAGQENQSLENSTRQQVAMQCLQKYLPPQALVQDVINQNFFPHLDNANTQKIILLSYMFHCLISCLLGRRKLDNTEEFRNKRAELAGDLLNQKLKSLVYQFQNNLKKRLEKLTAHGDGFMQQLQLHIDGSIITNGLQRALSTGDWILGRSGVSATLKRNNFLDTLCHLRQIRIPVPPLVRQDGRFFKNTYALGRVCMVETPDNENCGIVHKLAIGCEISAGSRDDPVLKILSQLCPQELTQIPASSMKYVTKVFLNGKWISIHDNPEEVVTRLRELRRQSYIHKQVEIVSNLPQKEIHIFCDAGRFLRPLIVVQETRPCITKQQFKELQLDGMRISRQLLNPGIVEVLGPEEEENCIVAEDFKELQGSRTEQGSKNYTHCQLHPSFSFSLSSNLIPFFNHNGYNRVMLQAQKHGKQAIGMYTSCMLGRSDTTSHQLFYPQRPLADTKLAKLTKHLCNGQNAIVAISPFGGYNQEDAIVINQASVDRGFFRSCHFHSFDFEVDARTEKFAKASSSSQKGICKASQDKLDEDGLPSIGGNFSPFDVLARKEGLDDSTKESSLRLNAVEKGRVDQVIVASDDEENSVARVRLREMRAPVDGDKFSSRHGQKGVVGFLCPQEDIFFTREGIVPDIIINPHAFPSRQSIGQLAEGIVAKIAAVSGKKVDATPFSRVEVHTLLEELQRLGYGDGKEMVMNGRTGEKLKNNITLNPVFYQRLVHMAMDKVKYRSRGRVDPYTRQPVSGRQRQGGVKFGEWERDCLIAHGASANLRERLFLLSDPYTVYVCNACNILVWREKQGLLCCSCKSRSHIVQVDMPYACKLLYQELFSMGIRLKFWTESY